MELVGSGMGAVSRARLQEEIPLLLAILGDLQLPVVAMPLREIAAAWTRVGGDRIVVVP